jgi:hypothetical protein
MSSKGHGVPSVVRAQASKRESAGVVGPGTEPLQRKARQLPANRMINAEHFGLVEQLRMPLYARRSMRLAGKNRACGRTCR